MTMIAMSDSAKASVRLWCDPARRAARSVSGANAHLFYVAFDVAARTASPHLKDARTGDPARLSAADSSC